MNRYVPSVALVIFGLLLIIVGRFDTWGLPETTAVVEGWPYWMGALLILLIAGFALPSR